jgi:hypothetical protein
MQTDLLGQRNLRMEKIANQESSTDLRTERYTFLCSICWYIGSGGHKGSANHPAAIYVSSDASRKADRRNSVFSGFRMFSLKDNLLFCRSSSVPDFSKSSYILTQYMQPSSVWPEQHSSRAQLFLLINEPKKSRRVSMDTFVCMFMRACVCARTHGDECMHTHACACVCLSRWLRACIGVCVCVPFPFYGRTIPFLAVLFFYCDDKRKTGMVCTTR